MIDLEFVRAVEAALVCAVTSALLDDNSPVAPCDMCAPEVRKLCKNAAERLFFELDGLALVDLGISKLAAEQQARPAGARAPSESLPGALYSDTRRHLLRASA